MTHPTDDRLWRDDPAHTDTTQHTATCPDCADRLYALRAFEAALADPITWQICDDYVARATAAGA